MNQAFSTIFLPSPEDFATRPFALPLVMRGLVFLLIETSKAQAPSLGLLVAEDVLPRQLPNLRIPASNRGRMTVMAHRFAGILLLAVCSGIACAQAGPLQNQAKKEAASIPAATSTKKSDPPATNATSPDRPVSEEAASASPEGDRDFSSSREAPLDLSPPKDDRKDHPNSSLPGSDEEDAETGVQEFHQWNPMKALKAIEVGDYYFKRKNYRAALDRYKEALEYKEGDAVATFHLAQCQERMGNREAALENYAAYLKILPHGPFAQEAGDAIEDLKAEASKK